MSRTVYHVSHGLKNQSKPWEVHKEGSDRASSRHKKKSAAVREAKRLAKKRRPSQVKVHKKNGYFQYEHTYGDDPRSSPG